MPLVSEGGGPGLGAQQASWALVGEANTLCSSPAPAPLVLEGPSLLPLLFSPRRASLLCPQDPRGLEGSLAGRGPGLGAQQVSQARVGRAIPLFFIAIIHLT